MAENLITQSMLKEWDTEILMSHIANLANTMNKELATHKAEIERLHSLISVLESRSASHTKRLDTVQGIR